MNEIKLAPPWGYSVFCDDIRKEADNKYSLMGIYSGQIYLPEFPALLSKFCVAVTYFEEFNKAPEDLCLRLYVPGDLPDVPSFFIPLPPMPKLAMPAEERTPEEVFSTVTMSLPFSQFEIRQEGEIRVRMKRGDQEVRLGTLQIRGAA